MSEQTPAVTDRELARMYQFAAEDRKVTISSLERHLLMQREAREVDANRYERYNERLEARCIKLESRNWLLLELLVLQTLVFAGICLWLYWRR